MSVAERVAGWNRWYDTMAGEWRFQYVIWSLLVLGAINMVLTVATGFPFALLVLLGIIAIAAIRIPYLVGWVTSPTGLDEDANIQIGGASWLIDLNHRYEALPEARRVWVYPATLLIAGAINMILTINYGFPFGLLFLIALLALVLIRAPYTSGWLQHSTLPAVAGPSIQGLPAGTSSSSETQITHEAHRPASIDQANRQGLPVEASPGEGAVKPHDREVENGGE